MQVQLNPTNGGCIECIPVSTQKSLISLQVSLEQMSTSLTYFLSLSPQFELLREKIDGLQQEQILEGLF